MSTPDYSDPASDSTFDETYDLAVDAADEGAVADLANAYGSAFDSTEQVRQSQAAARDLLPTLDASTGAAVTDYEAHKGRPATLAEVRWLNHQTNLAHERAAEPVDQDSAEDQAAYEADCIVEASGDCDDLADEL